MDEIKRMVNRFKTRKEVRTLKLTDSEIRETLILHAELQPRTCINCLHSIPNPHGRMSWDTRGCSLALSKLFRALVKQPCKLKKPILPPGPE